MHRTTAHTLAALALIATLLPRATLAQRGISLSPGLAIGGALDQASARQTGRTNGRLLMLTVDVASAKTPLRLRGEAMAVAANQSHGPVSLGAAAILPVGNGELRPYAIAGAAVYGVGGVGHPLGLNAGAGAEFRSKAMTVFAEARYHRRTPSALSLGVRF